MCSDTVHDEPAVVLRDVGKCYEIYARPVDRLKQTLCRGRRQYYREFWALRYVNLDIGRGEAVGIVGRNGSGKSTLLQIVAGTLSPTTGAAHVQGRIAALLELGSGFNPDFTGRENIFTNGAILGLSRREVLDRFDAIASFADIGDFLDQPVKTYSSGMMLRLAFAVQAQVDPDVLIVDEALSVGDERFQRKCFTRLDQLREQGTSILLVTHSSATVERYCDRAMLLDKGAVQGIGSSKDIIDQYHALLYADEQAGLQLLNDSAPAPKAPGSRQESAEEGSPAGPEDRPAAAPTQRDRRAQIGEIWVHNDSGESASWFETGQEVEIGFEVHAFDAIPELQAGMRIRTVEGIEVYGTSTVYHDASPGEVPADSRWRVTFRMRLDLCAGTYFLSVAIAEALSKSEMLYLDKRIDAVVFKIHEYPLTGTGTANLRSRVHVEQCSSVHAPQRV